MCKCRCIFFDGIGFEFFRRAFDVAVHELQETFILAFIGEVCDDVLNRQRFIKVERTFDILIDLSFEFNDFVIDLKSEGMRIFLSSYRLSPAIVLS